MTRAVARLSIALLVCLTMIGAFTGLASPASAAYCYGRQTSVMSIGPTYVHYRTWERCTQANGPVQLHVIRDWYEHV